MVDFLVLHGGLWAAIECKNVREWLYPERSEVKELIAKALHLDCVPVLIARRIHASTSMLFNSCGLIVHQTYNQLLATADADLAARARDKTMLGYHDIKVSNEPDARLVKFLTVNLPAVMPGARERFDEFKDLLTDYCHGDMSYGEFAARVRRRNDGSSEDSDWHL